MKKEKLLEVLCRACDRAAGVEHGAAAKRLSGFPGDGAAGGRAGDAGESISVARIPREALETPMTLWDWYRMNTRAGSSE